MKLRHVDGFAVLAVVVLFLSAMGHAQVGGSVAQMPVNGPSYSYAGNPQHAEAHDLRPEVSLLGNNSITTAHGERPLYEFGELKYETPLGTVAREYRATHAAMPKATIVFNKQ